MPTTESRPCYVCHGDGHFGSLMVSWPCQMCRGTGEIMLEVDRCSVCFGSGVDDNGFACSCCYGTGTSRIDELGKYHPPTGVGVVVTIVDTPDLVLIKGQILESDLHKELEGLKTRS